MPASGPKQTTEFKPGTTRPCPGCGRPVALDAALCTHCGQMIGSEQQLDTHLKRAERTGLPPIPTIGPGPGRFRDAPVDHEAKRIFAKSFLCILICLCLVAIWKGLDDGPREAIQYLIRYGITLAGAWFLAFLATMVFVEVGVSVALAALGIGAALAAGDLTQHIIHYTAIPTLAWMAAIMVFLFTISDLLDIELPEAAFISLLVYLMKWVLKITLFTQMFAESSGGAAPQ